MKARASRMALNVASEPELTNRTRSAQGTRSPIRRASRMAWSFSMEKKCVPARRLRRDRADDGLVRMAEDQRTRTEAVVDVLVAARVPEPGALSVAEHESDVVRQSRRSHHAAR